MSVIQQGWPQQKSDPLECVKPYYKDRDELTIANGLKFRGHRVVIPPPMQGAILADVHRSHIGVNGCQRRAKECIYWTGINVSIKNYVSQCQICRSMDAKQQKETLLVHEVPSKPGAKVAADLCTCEEQELLVTVD